eukprot:snap_masked-scaffold1139_size60066-processed-gene-0.2 protein:Tk01858 transcript:snap_masked-scaffold1139_size60066-processed-gene-0.2-mRNA-1 annotation:"hypothetical protein LOTGIDRAFT_164583"
MSDLDSASLASGSSHRHHRRRRSKSPSPEFEIGPESSKSSRRRASSSSSSSSKKTPKSILKNSNPNAPYKHETRTIEELVERERPRSISNSHHRHHKSRESTDASGSGHRHKSSRRRREGSAEEANKEEEGSRRSHHRHHGGSSSGSGSKNRSSGGHHHKSESGGEDTAGRKHHRRHHKSSKSSSSSGVGPGDRAEVTDEFDTVDRPKDNDKSRQRDEESVASALHANAIYDQPKVPAVKCSSNQRDSPERGRPGPELDSNTYTKEEVDRIYKAIVKAAEKSSNSKSADSFEPSLYENLAPNTASNITLNVEKDLTRYDNDPGRLICDDDDNVLYDVPRSQNGIVPAVLAAVVPPEFCDDPPQPASFNEDEEVIYQNEGNISGKNYDVPRRSNLEELSDFIPQEYDIPKIRDSLSTIEEEHQEYDIPRSSLVHANGSFVLSGQGSSGRGSVEDLFENQTYSVTKGSDNQSPSTQSHMFPQDKGHNFCDYTSQNDDRSSGYRSSSSPSIQSEELYANESAIASMEDLDSVGSSHKHSSPEPSTSPQVRDIAIETTLERHGEYKKTRRPDTLGRREMAREKERAKAEEIEQDIRRKREEAVPKTQKSSAPNHFFGGSMPESQERCEGVNFDEFDFEEVERRNYGPRKVEPPKPPPPPPPIIVHRQSKTMLKLEREHADEMEETVSRDNGLKMPSKFVPIVSNQKQQLEKKKSSFSSDASIVTREKNDRDDGPSIRPAPPPPPPPLALAPSVIKTSSSDVQIQAEPCDKTAERKRQQQKDRSVDVYHETVRQRVAASRPKVEKILSQDTFSPPFMASSKSVGSSSAENNNSPLTTTDFSSVATIKKTLKKTRAPLRPSLPAPPPPPPPVVAMSADPDPPLTPQNHQSQEEEDMPSVRQLRSRFELESEQENEGHPMGPGSNGTSPTKKSFLVMASLTRRGAIMMSKSLQQKEEKYRKSEASQGGATLVTKSSRGGSNKSGQLADGDEEDHGNSANSSSHDKHRVATFRMSVVGEDSSLVGKEDREEVVLNGHWNPVAIVNRLYHMLQVDDNEVEKNSADSAHIEGFLERLPSGKKKSTLWNSWKKQYFVAKKGILYSYGDDTCRTPMEVVELFGGRVEYIDAKVLGIHDRRGHYLSVRCPSDKLALKWETAINGHINQDFSKTFVTPSPIPKSLSYYTQTLVIDIGGSSVRAGVASKVPSLPQLFFPSVMAVDHQQECSKYFGMDAFAKEIRTRSKLSHPMVPSHNVDKYTVDQTALQGIFEKVFKDLALEPNDFEIQLSVPRSFNDRTKHAIAGMLFEEFGVRSVNMAHQTTFAFYSYNAKSGIMVDIGERMDIVPIVDGYKLQAGVSRSPVGGKELRSKLQHYLLGRNYSLTSFVDSFVTRYAIERLSYMSPNFDLELEKYHDDPELIDKGIEVAPQECLDAPVRTLELGSERFEACEGLFKPELWGLDQAGVHVLVHKAIKECSMDVRKEMTQSIFLSGGLTLIPGFRKRLEIEIERLTPVKPRVHASPYRYHAAYLGASVHALSDAFQESRITRTAWTQSCSQLDRYWTL